MHCFAVLHFHFTKYVSFTKIQRLKGSFSFSIHHHSPPDRGSGRDTSLVHKKQNYKNQVCQHLHRTIDSLIPDEVNRRKHHHWFNSLCLDRNCIWAISQQVTHTTISSVARNGPKNAKRYKTSVQKKRFSHKGHKTTHWNVKSICFLGIVIPAKGNQRSSEVCTFSSFFSNNIWLSNVRLDFQLPAEKMAEHLKWNLMHVLCSEKETRSTSYFCSNFFLQMQCYLMHWLRKNVVHFIVLPAFNAKRPDSSSVRI